ncbi:MAG: hypothetical protein GW878_00760 [Acidobacteria bacterium]|nr:hypothetical protein [Acidobacteriota bacterium]
MSRHLWREVGRQLRESGTAGAVAVLLVTIATAWGGILWTVRSFVVSELLDRARSTTIVAVVPQAPDLATVERALKRQFPTVVARTLGSAEVQKELAGWFPDISAVLLGLDQGSFPPLVQITTPTGSEDELMRWLRTRSDITLIETSRAWQDQLDHLIGRALIVAFAVALALLVGCGLVLLLVVRLLVLEHDDEVAVMRLIGARERDIRVPYLLCGTLLGTAGGILGMGIYLGLGIALRGAFPALVIGAGVAAALPSAGALAGAVGAGLGIAALHHEP